MRTLILVAATATGITAGVLSAWGRGTGLQFAMACLGGAFALSLGAGVVALLGMFGRTPPTRDKFDLSLQLEDQLQDDYWLDRGRLTASPGLPHADDLDSNSGEP